MKTNLPTKKLSGEEAAALLELEFGEELVDEGQYRRIEVRLKPDQVLRSESDLYYGLAHLLSTLRSGVYIPRKTQLTSSWSVHGVQDYKIVLDPLIIARPSFLVLNYQRYLSMIEDVSKPEYFAPRRGVPLPGV